MSNALTLGFVAAFLAHAGVVDAPPPSRKAPVTPPTEPSPDDDAPPTASPAPTPWALSGARGWRLCRDAELQARAARRGPRGGTGGPDDVLWARRAEQCPHAPTVLALAAEREISQANELLSGVENWDREGEELAKVASAHQRRMRRAHDWLQAAIDESARRGSLPPPETYYYRAYALTTMGDNDAAAVAVAEAATHRDVADHRLQRMSALVHLFAGDLKTSLRLAHRAVIDAPDGDRLISRYIYALVLDRAGALHSAAQEFKSLQRESGRHAARLAVESVLPVHERLFLRALDHQVAERHAHASRVWEQYLSREEPEEPERVLARRHRAELDPR